VSWDRTQKKLGRGASAGTGRFNAVRLTRGGACLEYEVAGVPVSEWIEARLENGQRIVNAAFGWVPHGSPSGSSWGGHQSDEVARLNVSLSVTAGRAVELLVNPKNDDSIIPKGRLNVIEPANKLLVAHVLPSPQPIEFSIAIGPSSNRDIRGWSRATDADAPSPLRWPQKPTTRGTIAAPTNAYVIDNISLRWKTHGGATCG